MGQAPAGQQNAAGDQFSTETFLTNYNRLSPEAKRILFSDSGTQQGMEALATGGDMLRQGSKVFANPSGTAGGAVTTGALVAGLLNPALGMKIAAGVAAANGAARLLTNPNFVKWIGQATQVSQAATPAMLNQLVQQSQGWSAEDRAAAASFMQALGAQR